MSRLLVAIAISACFPLSACKDPLKEQLKQTTIPTYDPTTGKLKELTFDFNKNGRIDTWTQMDGARPVSCRQDLNEDGKVDRWEYYDATGTLVKVGLSRQDLGAPDTWAYPNAQGLIERVEVSSTGKEKEIDRWETYKDNLLVGVKEDTNDDGRPDTFQEYENGTVRWASFDENFDGVPDRRLTYNPAGWVILVETEPDGRSGFRTQTPVRGDEHGTR